MCHKKRKCNREIVALVDNERVMVLENRRGNGQVGQVKVSVQKTKGCKQMQSMRRAAMILQSMPEELRRVAVEQAKVLIGLER